MFSSSLTIVENLAAVGYEQNTIHLASYDWRLFYGDLERRDGYFTKLASAIENSHRLAGNKVAVLAHSMGSLVWLYFMKWVESPIGGNRGKNWINDHVHAFVNIGGPLLGVPKSLPSIISGETRDTAQLGKFETYVLDLFFSKSERAQLFRSWGSLLSMLPKGGEAIWGNVLTRHVFARSY